MAKPKVDIKVLDNRTMLMDGVLHILVPISDISCDGCMLRVDGGYICRNYSNELPNGHSVASALPKGGRYAQNRPSRWVGLGDHTR